MIGTFDFSQAFQDEVHQPFTLDGSKRFCAVLVHGFPGTPHEMRPIANVLHGIGWTVQALLLPGFGIEINSLPEKTYTEWLSAVLNRLNQCRQHYDHVILVGFSMGGAIAIQASVSTQIDGLLLLAPFSKIDHILWRLFPALRHIIPNFKPFRLFNLDFSDPEIRKNICVWLPSADLDDPHLQEQIRNFTIPTQLINQIRIAGDHARQSAPHINIPTTVIQGLQDELVTPRVTQTLIQSMTTDVNYIPVDGDHNLTDLQKPAWGTVKDIIRQYAIEFEDTR